MLRLILSESLLDIVFLPYFPFFLFLFDSIHLMKVLLCILQLRLLFMLTSVVLVFYLLSNFICNLDKHLLLFFVIIRSLFLERHYFIVLQHLLVPLIYLCLCHYELREFLSLFTSLLCLEVVEFVIPRETVNQTVPALTAA